MSAVATVAKLIMLYALFGPCCGSALALGQQVGDGALQLFAVNVSGGLYGVYLGDGLVLTAEHVVGHAKTAQVRVAGRNLEAEVVKAGDFEKVDLTLLSVDPKLLPPQLGLRRMPVCAHPPIIGQNVVVATPQAIARSRIMSPLLLPPVARERFNTVISDVATTGNSGSGVFDPADQCLMGIMSRKIRIPLPLLKQVPAPQAFRDVAKYFVPAEQIREFLGGKTF